MLKRNIAILIAGGLLGAQVGIAAAQQTSRPAWPTSAIGGGALLQPAIEYFKQRDASDPNPTGAAQRPAWASSAIGGGGVPPVAVKYLDSRRQATAASASVFDGDCLASADDTAYWSRKGRN